MNTVTPRTLVLCLLVAVVAAGCARREIPEDEGGTAASPTAPAIEEAAPAKEVAALEIEVILSPAAEERLKNVGEKVRVEVTYGGDPAPGASLQPNEMGMIALGGTVLELDGSGTVALPESAVDMSRLDQILGQPQVMVNTTSSRRQSAQNLLACDFYWDTLTTAGQDGVRVPCKLLSE